MLLKFLKVKRRVFCWALCLYLGLLAGSWSLDDDRPSPLPKQGGWLEVLIEPLNDEALIPAPLRFREFSGSDAGLTPVLLIHGSPMSSNSFDNLLEQLPENRTYFVPDLPGFGHSKYGFTDYSFEGHARALTQLLDAEGVDSVHLVAYSQGGGSALRLLSEMPERISSLTLLSSIGVIEYELAGDYFLNQLLYGVQLTGLKLLDWGVPHFGLLDQCLLNPRYADNFYSSDMRPLRSIMESVDVPVLILHSESDFLVPESAALEHFRILPQSSIHWGKGGLGMLMSQPEWVSRHLSNFLSTVDEGHGRSRAQASGQRVMEAERDYRVVQRENRSAAALVIVCVAIIFGTFISEDLACITAGLLAARGLIPLNLAILACFTGIWGGDMLLYAVGRYGGGRLRTCWPFKKIVSQARLESTQAWLNRYGGFAIFLSRFMPGTRLPLYFTAGLVRMNVYSIMFWLALAGVLWVFPVIALVAYFGEGFSEWLIDRGTFIIPGIIFFLLLLFVLLKVTPVLMTHEGRRKLFANWQRIIRWEFWPAQVVYLPVVLVLFFKLIGKKKPLAFTSCNPGMPLGGLLGESKKEILDNLVGSGCVPRYLWIPKDQDGKLQMARDWIDSEGLTYPLVIKPDQGERGRDVQILDSETELKDELQRRECDTLVQEYASGLEFGVFYLRHPDEAYGSVISLTRKVMTSVNGDGKSTLKELILNDSRAVLSYRHFFKTFEHRLLDIPTTGQVVTLAPLGSHCRGSLFLNGADLITPALEAEVDRISKHFQGFYIGRFDIRCPSESDLQLGNNLKVIELNGVSSEQTHIYHPHTSLRIGLKTITQQWQKAHEIGLINHRKGAPVASFRALFNLLKKT